jgi:hypothetical protein
MFTDGFEFTEKCEHYRSLALPLATALNVMIGKGGDFSLHAGTRSRPREVTCAYPLFGGFPETLRYDKKKPQRKNGRN